MSIVFHCATAAPVDQGLNQKLMYAVNVAGTTNVINACINAGVSVLVYTSSASVVYEGHDLIGVDESAPYAVRPMDYYTQTKVRYPLGLVLSAILWRLYSGGCNCIRNIHSLWKSI